MARFIPSVFWLTEWTMRWKVRWTFVDRTSQQYPGDCFFSVCVGLEPKIGSRPPRSWRSYIIHNETDRQTQTHTHTHTNTPARTALNEGSARRRGRYLHNKQQTQETNIPSISGSRNRDPSNRAAADLRPRPHGHRDWPEDCQSRDLCKNSVLLIKQSCRINWYVVPLWKYLTKAEIFAVTDFPRSSQCDLCSQCSLTWRTKFRYTVFVSKFLRLIIPLIHFLSVNVTHTHII